MAYAALLSLSQTIDDLLHDDHNNLYTISLPEKQQFISIHEYVIFFQAFLENFPEKANSLEEQMRDVANEAEDIIKYFMLKRIQLYHFSKSTAGPESVKFPHHQISGLFIWLTRKKSSHMSFDSKKWNKVTKNIESIAGEVMKIKKNTGAKDVQATDFSAASSSSRLGKKHMKLRLHFNLKELKKEARQVMHPNDSSAATSSSRPIAPTSKDSMVGFDDDLMAIKARLCGESSKLEVIPIFGMGGIGKTTLARNAYDDPLTLEHFQVRAWVTVSQDYSAQEIFSRLLVSLKAERSEGSIESMVQNAYQHLKGRRYLIIMDDMWSTKVWDDVKMIFPDDCNGSRIMLTTRLSDVAAYPDSSGPLHEMRFMDADRSWNLLQQKVFAGENCPPELETIGKVIAKSCRGLPLAIVLIAGLLSTVSKTQASWRNIAENINLAISSTNDEQFAKILSLSYIQLPHYLRPCFLYMGSFPEDHEIRASKLIKLWIAEGFLKPSRSKSFEEEAEECLEDLVKRSLILITERKSNDKIKSCSVHDLVRDLCIRKAQEDKFHLNVRYARKIHLKSIKSQRRITIAHSDIHRLGNISSPTIRTIICFHHDGSSLSSFGNSRLLRVLDMVPKKNDRLIVGIETMLPTEVFELFHLRYLALTTYTTSKQFVLPPSIINLQNLQTLNIHSSNGCCLPKEIWRMQQLRHLIFKGPLPNVPQGAATFPLENLQTLSGVEDFKCTEEILKMIPNLKTLGIYYLKGPDEYVEDYHLNNLVNLHRLENLTVDASGYVSFVGKLTVFPRMLKKLTLNGRIVPWKDMGIIGSLPNLQVLKLKKNCSFLEYKWETREGEFSQLKFLLIDLAYFWYWITESSHFPHLKHLVLYRCFKLSEIPDGIGEIPTLEQIQIGYNPFLVDSAKKLQEKQAEYSGDTTFQVHEVWPWLKD